MKAGLAVLGLGAAAAVGFTFWAIKDANARHGNADPFEFKQVTGDSGTNYLVTSTTREMDGQTVVIVAVLASDETPILVYQQFQGDNESRIWDKAAGGLPTDNQLWLTAVQDFGVFTSV